MAQVNVFRLEAKQKHLPPICMCCGAPAKSYVLRYFHWNPVWVLVVLLLGFVQVIIVAVVVIARREEMQTASAWICPLSLGLAALPFIAVLASTKRARLHAPLCRVHRAHWWGRSLLLALSFTFVVAATIGSFVWVAVQPAGNPLSGLFCMGSAFFLVAWCVLAVVVQATAIRPVEINATMLRLTNVSPRFVDALVDGPALDDEQPVVEAIDTGVVADEPRRPPLPPDGFVEGK
jgi:hypothetical protein